MFMAIVLAIELACARSPLTLALVSAPVLLGCCYICSFLYRHIHIEENNTIFPNQCCTKGFQYSILFGSSMAGSPGWRVALLVLPVGYICCPLGRVAGHPLGSPCWFSPVPPGGGSPPWFSLVHPGSLGWRVAPLVLPGTPWFSRVAGRPLDLPGFPGWRLISLWFSLLLRNQESGIQIFKSIMQIPDSIF